jgi:hypothetical protein
VKKILIHAVLLIAICCRAFAFPTMSDDSWYTQTQTKTNKTVYTSQTAIGYDPFQDKLWMFNGHPPGGGYPQPDDTMGFDIATNTWASVRSVNSSTPPAS